MTTPKQDLTAEELDAFERYIWTLPDGWVTRDIGFKIIAAARKGIEAEAMEQERDDEQAMCSGWHKRWKAAEAEKSRLSLEVGRYKKALKIAEPGMKTHTWRKVSAALAGGAEK